MKTLIALLLAVPSALMGGLVFSKMWGWFLVRKFPTAPSLTYLDAAGLLMVLGFPLIPLAMNDAREELKKQHPDMSSAGRSITMSIAMLVFVYPLLLGVAWIWHQFIGN